MIVSIAEKIRKVASLIERDNTPSYAAIGDRHMLEDNEEDSSEGTSSNVNSTPLKKKPVSAVPEAAPKPTAAPEQRRPRELQDHLKKWNSTTSTGLMNEYMKNYRAEGKDVETGNAYKKKFKV